MSSSESTERVDATHPVLAQIVDAASRGFTGSVDIAATDSVGRDLQVSVYLDEGSINAVHAVGWEPPAAEYVRFATGHDFSDREEPAFKLAYETPGDDGQPLMDSDAIDRARRAWAYGLLAATLTWDRPKLSRTKKAMPAGNRIIPSPWQRVMADISARVEGMQSGWQVVCDALQTAGIPPVSAGHAGGGLAVLISGHPMFDGTASLDRVAGQNGLTRYAVVDELSNQIVSGVPVDFRPAAADDAPILIPEHWEDPARPWGRASVTLPVVEVDQAPDPEPAGELEPEPEMELEEPVTDDEFLMATLGGGEVEQSGARDAEVDVVPEPVTPIGAAPSEPSDADALLTQFLSESTDDGDALVRGSIVRRLRDSAQEEAERRDAEVAQLEREAQQARQNEQRSAAAVAAADRELDDAKGAMAQAAAEVERLTAEHADHIESARVAQEAADTAEQVVSDVQEQILALRAQVAELEQREAQARTAAATARATAEEARSQVDQVAGPVLQQANDIVERVRIKVLVPAQQRSAEAREGAQQATRDVEDLERALAAARLTAAQARTVAIAVSAERVEQAA